MQACGLLHWPFPTLMTSIQIPSVSNIHVFLCQYSYDNLLHAVGPSIWCELSDELDYTQTCWLGKQGLEAVVPSFLIQKQLKILEYLQCFLCFELICSIPYVRVHSCKSRECLKWQNVITPLEHVKKDKRLRNDFPTMYCDNVPSLRTVERKRLLCPVPKPEPRVPLEMSLSV